MKLVIVAFSLCVFSHVANRLDFISINNISKELL